ncbi:MAG TPA: hypothetical protein VM240_05440 [Verrucomicrobiae bacterium]|nr:hypothetical protein [Verrucomicrobiae bacterium]
MAVRPYAYKIEECDVPAARHGAIREYRLLRDRCLEALRGEDHNSVTHQVHGLCWQTAVFRTLNEGRRIEPDSPVNGATWELLTAGYASLMVMGVRKLVDTDRRTNSIWNVVTDLERNNHQLRRENHVCHDGLPYDFEAVQQRHIEHLREAGQLGKAHWLETSGANAYEMSRRQHEAFDDLAGRPTKRQRADTVAPAIFQKLKENLQCPAILKVTGWANRLMAHAQKGAAGIPVPTYNDLDAAMRAVVRVTTFVSTQLLADAAFGTVVPTPQFDVLANLDRGWISKANISALHSHWDQITASMDAWAYEAHEHYAPDASSEE